MNLFYINVLLAIIWQALSNQFNFANFVFGFVFGYLILWLTSAKQRGGNYFNKIPAVISFTLFFIKELIVANLRIAYDIVTPKDRMSPAIVAYPLDLKRDFEITIMANLITLTPGTLSVDVSEDRKTLYIHYMYFKDKDEFIDEIKNGFEKRIMEIFK